MKLPTKHKMQISIVCIIRIHKNNNGVTFSRSTRSKIILELTESGTRFIMPAGQTQVPNFEFKKPCDTSAMALQLPQLLSFSVFGKSPSFIEQVFDLCFLYFAVFTYLEVFLLPSNISTT